MSTYEIVIRVLPFNENAEPAHREDTERTFRFDREDVAVAVYGSLIAAAIITPPTTYSEYILYKVGTGAYGEAEELRTEMEYCTM